MQSDSSSLDTLKDNLLRAVDAEYNVLKAQVVLDIIYQLEKMTITKDQLQTTRLGREINTIRQKIDARKKDVQHIEKYPELINEIAHRAKKLLRSWQGLLNTSQTDSSAIPSSTSANIADTKPRLILKVKFNSPITKRKRDSDCHPINGTNVKRKKTQVMETPVPVQTSISPVISSETNNSLPRLKTTQQLLMEMQMNEPSVLASQTSTVNAILQKKIIDESLHETVKLDYSAIHNGKELNNTNLNSSHIPKQLSSSVISPSNTYQTPGLSSKRQSLIRHPVSALRSSNTNWENGSSAGSPVSPLSSSSSSSITSTTSWPVSTTIPEPTLSIPKKKRRKKPDEQLSKPTNSEQSTTFSSDVATLCASYNTIADLVEDHRRRILAAHDTRELEARPDLLLVPIDQLAFVYEREQAKKLTISSQSNQLSLTTVQKLHQPSDLIALPFIDCSFEFDLILDELIVQHPTWDM